MKYISRSIAARPVGTLRQLPPIIDTHAHPLLRSAPIPPGAVFPPWSPELLIESMDKAGITATILSVPAAAALPRDARGAALARKINEELATLVSAHPTRLGGLAILPIADPDTSLKEMVYALDTLKLDGVVTNTNLDGNYLGDPLFDPWLEELDRRQGTLFIHPFPTTASVQAHPLDPVILDVPFDTTRMLLNMVGSGAAVRYANIAKIAAHGGGTLPFLLERILGAATLYGLGKGRPPVAPDQIRAQLGTFYYDLALATSQSQLVGLHDLVPASHLVLGFDLPAAPVATVPVAIEAITSFEGFSSADLSQIASGTALRLYPQLARRLAEQIKL